MTRHNKGLSLIELLISIGLGLALASGLSLFYQELASTNSAILQETQLQISSSKALQAIDFAIEHAGYVPNKLVGTPKEHIYRKSTVFPKGEAFKTETNDDSNRIHVRTAGESNIIFSDCLGEDVTSNEIVEMGFYITEDKLICNSKHISEETEVYEDVIANNIEIMRVTQFGTNQTEQLKYIIPPLMEKPPEAQVNSLLLELVTYSKDNIYHTEKAQVLTYSDNSQFATVSRQKYALFSKHMNIFNNN